jgi:hypothetical protein
MQGCAGIAVAHLAGMRVLPSIASIATLAYLATGCVANDSSLAVSNRSDFEIHEMYVTPVHSSSWGVNLLDGDILYPGDSMLISIDCGTYDAMLIDETGAVCEVSDLHLCFDDADWIIRNSSCSVFAARAAEAAAQKGAK